MVKIREALISDVSGIVDVNIKTWQSAYKGIISDETLNRLDSNKSSRIERNIKEFGQRFVEGERVLQAVAEKNGNVVGFVSYGKCRDEKTLCLTTSAEIYAIYVLEEYQGKGIGRDLLCFAFDQLKNTKKYNKVLIWTLKDNRKRYFYEQMGGQNKFNRSIEIAGERFDEVGYLYNDLNIDREYVDK